MKYCKRCNESKPLTGFYKCSGSKDGLQGKCRPCQKALASEWNKSNRERYRENDRARYYRDPKKRNAVSKSVRLKKIDEYRARDREYNKARYATDPKSCYEKSKRWMDRNREKVKAKRDRANAARRARVANALGDHTESERKELCASYSHLCVYCTKSVIAKHLDHVVPLAGGGCNHVENLVPACSFCNQSKGDSSLLSFMFYRAKRVGIL